LGVMLLDLAIVLIKPPLDQNTSKNI